MWKTQFQILAWVQFTVTSQVIWWSVGHERPEESFLKGIGSPKEVCRAGKLFLQWDCTSLGLSFLTLQKEHKVTRDTKLNKQMGTVLWQANTSKRKVNMGMKKYTVNRLLSGEILTNVFTQIRKKQCQMLDADYLTHRSICTSLQQYCY